MLAQAQNGQRVYQALLAVLVENLVHLDNTEDINDSDKNGSSIEILTQIVQILSDQTDEIRVKFIQRRRFFALIYILEYMGKGGAQNNPEAWLYLQAGVQLFGCLVAGSSRDNLKLDGVKKI